jgi:SAM-dependent methyltransferase
MQDERTQDAGMTTDRNIHPSASAGFQKEAARYERGRPDYPVAAIECLKDRLRLGAASRVLDLGAGTGKLSRLIAPGVGSLVAVEPVPAMRETLLKVLPEVEVLDGTAERIPLDTASVDAVVVAQAFHWFDGNRALPEIARVLKPQGALGLMWNMRDESSGWMEALTGLLDEYESGAPRYRTFLWKGPFDSTSLFTRLELSSFSHEQRVDRNGLIDRVSSISYIAALGERERAELVQKLEYLLNNHPDTWGKETFVIPYRTDVYSAHKK